MSTIQDGFMSFKGALSTGPPSRCAEKPVIRALLCYVPCFRNLDDAPASDDLDGYDLVIKCSELESVLDHTKGWPMSLSSRAHWPRLNSRDTIKVGIVGNYNRGKTTLTNLMSGREARVGNLVHTEGLSVAVDGSFAFIDTAGENQPLLFNSIQPADTIPTNPSDTFVMERKVKDDINKRLVGSMFLQDMVYELCDLLVVVVNQLTLEDQHYIMKLREKLSQMERQGPRARRGRSLLVVHNLKDVFQQRDMDKLIEKDIEQAFKGQKQVWRDSDSRPYIYWKAEGGDEVHAVIANHHSPAGRAWNAQTVAFLKGYLQGKSTLPSNSRGLLHGFDAHVCANLWKYFKGMTEDDFKSSKRRFCCTNDKDRLFVCSSPTVQLEKAELKKDAQVLKWELMWTGARGKYQLDYEVMECHDKTVVCIDLPGVFRGNPKDITPSQPTNGKGYKQQFTWEEDGQQVLSVLVRLVHQKSPPGIEVTATRRDMFEAGHTYTRRYDSGMRGVAVSSVDLVPGVSDFDAFKSVEVSMGENGVLTVSMEPDRS